MEKILRKIQGKPVFQSLILILFGAVIFFWPNGTLQFLCTTAGIALLIAGVSGIIQQRRNRKYGLEDPFSLLMNGAAAVAGIALIILYKSILSFIPAVIGIGVVIVGIQGLWDANRLRKVGYSGAPAGMLLSLITVILGLVIFSNPFRTVTLLLAVTGASLMYTGVTRLWIHR